MAPKDKAGSERIAVLLVGMAPRSAASIATALADGGPTPIFTAGSRADLGAFAQAQ